jgi:hypothetical protein
MMRKFILILFILPLIFIACNKDNNNNPDIPAGYQLQIGNTGNAVFYSNMQVPDSTYVEGQHLTTREIDLDGDSEIEFFIISEMDSIDNEIEFRSLRIEKNADFDGTINTYLHPAIELLSPQYFSDGEVVIIGEWLYPIDQVIYLAQVTDNYVTDEQEYLGVWNGANQLNFIIQMDKDGKSNVSWIKISVTDYDKYIFYNYATFEM